MLHTCNVFSYKHLMFTSYTGGRKAGPVQVLTSSRSSIKSRPQLLLSIATGMQCEKRVIDFRQMSNDKQDNE